MHAGLPTKQAVAGAGAVSTLWMEEEATDADVAEGALEAMLDKMVVVMEGAI